MHDLECPKLFEVRRKGVAFDTANYAKQSMKPEVRYIKEHRPTAFGLDVGENMER